ncbi:MAG: glucokinase, partial [Gammaproteobacteria bacterium]
MSDDTRTVLAGDIGGTKTRLAICAVTGNRLEPLSEHTYASREHATLDELVADFLARNERRLYGACFGIAGPVKGTVADVTNLPWHIDATAIGQRFNLPRVALLNDLEANAWGIRILNAGDFRSLNGAMEDLSGSAAIIAAGTGLGEAGLFRDGDRLRPFATEGGHADFSPGNEIEIELLRFLLQRHTHVSWERVLSGPGLVTLHDFLRQYRGHDLPDWLREEMRSGDPAAAISQAAQAGRDAVCREALALFVHLYGVEAGNLALKMKATGGVYIGGGIAPKILAQLEDGTFLEAFYAKGRMRPLLEQ